MKHYASAIEDYDYIKVFSYRNMLHYTTYIDSKRLGYAEAFCNVDSETFQELCNDYLYSLRKFGSNLPLHLQSK